MLSERLRRIADALPLRSRMRVLEIGCGPGALAREISSRVADCHVLALDRSAKAIRQAEVSCANEIAAGRLAFRCIAVEDFVLINGESLFDLAVAVRVGALDGRYPKAEAAARARIRAALAPGAPLYVDLGDPLVRIVLSAGR